MLLSSFSADAIVNRRWRLDDVIGPLRARTAVLSGEQVLVWTEKPLEWLNTLYGSRLNIYTIRDCL